MESVESVELDVPDERVVPAFLAVPVRFVVLDLFAVPEVDVPDDAGLL